MIRSQGGLRRKGVAERYALQNFPYNNLLTGHGDSRIYSETPRFQGMKSSWAFSSALV